MRINRQILIRLALFLFMVPLHAGADRAQTPAPSSPPATLTHSPDDQYSKEPYVFELIERNIRFEADGKGQHDLKLRVRVQSESAVREFGLLVYQYASSFETLDVIYVRV